MLSRLISLAFATFSCVGISAAQTSRNVLLICVDDLRPELRCFGADYIESPNIDSLAARGRAFRQHYVQAPTCGASRYTLLTGRYGGEGNNALFDRAAKLNRQPGKVPPSMPAWFRKAGYETVSVGKVSHHPGGRGGPDWDDESKTEMPDSWDQHLLPTGTWQHPRGWMHGLANGEIRLDPSKMDVLQSTAGDDSVYPDGISIDEAISQLKRLSGQDSQPFFLAVGILRPHLPFGAPAKYLTPYKDIQLPTIPHPSKPEHRSSWHGSGEFMRYNRWGFDPRQDDAFATKVRQHYAACVSYADAQVGRLIDCLEQSGSAENTTIVLWGDHGWHLGEHAVWGKHTLFEESLHSPLIICDPTVNQPGQPTDSIVETLDVFPTLCELTGVETPDYVDGVSLAPLLKDHAAQGHDAFAYRRKMRTIRTTRYRMIHHQDGYVELYDHESTAGETRNIATQKPDVIERLKAKLDQRLSQPR